MTQKEAIEYFSRRQDLPLDDKPKQAERLALDALKKNAGLLLLAEWAEECGFGYDNIPEEYEKHKKTVEKMGYLEGLIYIAQQEALKEEEADE